MTTDRELTRFVLKALGHPVTICYDRKLKEAGQLPWSADCPAADMRWTSDSYGDLLDRIADTIFADCFEKWSACNARTD